MSAEGQSPLLLVVDDDPVIRLLTTQTLASQGYRVAEAEHGREAMVRLGAGTPDLILLDLMMPEMDGLAFCAWLRRQPGGEHLPVLMMTGMDDGDSIEQAFEAGASDFIPKPINWPILVQRVRFLLRASQTLEALAESEANLAEAQRVAQIGSWVLDHESGALTWSDQVFRIFELDPERFGRSYPDFLERVNPEERQWVDQIFRASVRDHTPYEVEHRLLLPDGRIKWVQERGITEYSVEGQPRLTRGTVQDITARRENEETIRYLSLYDGLTDLPNRSLFLQTLNRLIAQAQHRHGELAILHLGLDRFSRVNDSFGHEAGDETLRQVAQRLRTCLGQVDRVNRRGGCEGHLDLARWGGDELAVVLGRTESSTDAAWLASRLLEDLSRPYRVNGQDISLTASAGIALYPADGSTASHLVGNACAAMRHAKGRERGSFCFYQRAMNAQSWLRLSLENDLRRALRHDELRVHYQPQVDQDGRLCGAEALVRWQHPEHGLLGPDRFIPLAEESGLIIPLGEWVLQTACAQSRAWRERGYPPLRIAVNLSAAQFRHRGLLPMILASLSRADLMGADVELELTESLIIDHLDETRALMERLHREGLSLAIDDFGTGYSSLSHLSSLPLHTLKIDRAFVREMLNDPRQDAIVRSIVALAKNLNLTVVAEGVESPEQAQKLLSEGCERMQGFLYDRPLSAEAFERWLAPSLPPRPSVSKPEPGSTA